MQRNIDFYYFTGTGNTLIIVKKIKEILEKHGFTLQLHKMEKETPSQVNIQNTIGIAFPVAGLSTFPFVWDFLLALPKTNGTEIFMVDTLGGGSGGIIGPLKNILSRKGYKCIGAKEIRMPSNIFYVNKDKANKKLIERGIKLAQEYAMDLVKGKCRWGRIPVLSDILYFISRLLLASWKIKLGQKYFAYKLVREKCTKCGICAQICPVKNIAMDEYPKYLLKCQYCLRCVSFCPEKALEIPFNYKNKTYSAVSVKELLE